MKVEHVQPVQSLSPQRHAAVRTWLAVAIPIVALLVVVAGGLLGRAPEARPVPVAIAEASSAPSSAIPSRTRLPDRPSVVVDLAAAGFPSDTLGLPVRSVAATLERIRDGKMRESVVAVAGWLTVGPSDGDCQVDGPSAASISFCPRETILLDSPEPFLAIVGGDAVRVRSPGGHLHATALPGKQAVLLAGRQYRGLGPSLLPVQVVIVGRVGDPRLPDCRRSERHCGEILSLERVIWVDGEWQERVPVTMASAAEESNLSSEDRRRRIGEAVRGAGTVLSEVLLPRELLAGVDPHADRAAGDAGAGPVWYVRTLIRVSGPGGSYPRDVGWAVLDDATGRVLAADPAFAAVTASR
jgi:hypothetical protein